MTLPLLHEVNGVRHQKTHSNPPPSRPVVAPLKQGRDTVKTLDKYDPTSGRQMYGRKDACTPNLRRCKRNA